MKGKFILALVALNFILGSTALPQEKHQKRDYYVDDNEEVVLEEQLETVYETVMEEITVDIPASAIIYINETPAIYEGDELVYLPSDIFESSPSNSNNNSQASMPTPTLAPEVEEEQEVEEQPQKEEEEEPEVMANLADIINETPGTPKYMVNLNQEEVIVDPELDFEVYEENHQYTPEESVPEGNGNGDGDGATAPPNIINEKPSAAKYLILNANNINPKEGISPTPVVDNTTGEGEEGEEYEEATYIIDDTFKDQKFMVDSSLDLEVSSSENDESDMDSPSYDNDHFNRPEEQAEEQKEENEEEELAPLSEESEPELNHNLVNDDDSNSDQELSHREDGDESSYQGNTDNDDDNNESSNQENTDDDSYNESSNQENTDNDDSYNESSNQENTDNDDDNNDESSNQENGEEGNESSHREKEEEKEDGSSPSTSEGEEGEGQDESSDHHSHKRKKNIFKKKEAE